MRNIVIVGAGAIGCLFAARLVQAGAVVTLVDVDRGRLAALGREGITLADQDGDYVVPVRAALEQLSEAVIPVRPAPAAPRSESQ